MYTLMRNSLRVFLIVLFLIMALFTRGGLSQEQYPNRPITVVVSWGAGGINDLIARAICKSAEKELGQPIIVENRPGGSGATGMNYVLKSKPDGYILGQIASAGFLCAPHVQKVPYNVLTDVTDVAAFGKSNQLLCLRSDAPWNTFEELIAYAKKNPGKFKYAVSGISSTQRIVMERIALKEGIKWTAIPFKSGGESVVACLGGNADGVTQSSVETSPHIKEGKLKLLLVLSDSRLQEFPNIPTILEKGYHFDATAYFSIYGPKGLPEPIIQTLENAIKRATSDPSYIRTTKQFQTEVAYLSGKDFSAYWRSKYDEWGEAIKALGLAGK